MMEVIKDWVWLFTAISPFILAIGMLYLRSQFPTKAEHKVASDGLQASFGELKTKVDQKHSETERRLSHLETVTDHLPSRTDISALERRLADVERQGAVTGETMRGIDRVVSKMDRTLDMILQNQLQENRP